MILLQFKYTFVTLILKVHVTVVICNNIKFLGFQFDFFCREVCCHFLVLNTFFYTVLCGEQQTIIIITMAIIN